MSDGVTITKTITPAKSVLTVRDPKLGKISKSQAWINQVVDSISLDPVAFLESPPKARLDALLSAIPMRVQAAELAFCPAEALRGVDLDRHALEVLGQVGKTVYDLRTGVNRAAREKRATAMQMTAALPQSPKPAGLPDQVTWLDVYETRLTQFRELQKSTSARATGIKRDAELAKQATINLYNKKRERLNEEAMKELDAVKLRFAGLIRQAEDERNTALPQIDAHTSGALAAVKAQYDPRNTDLSNLCAEAKAQVDLVQKSVSTREFIATLEADAEKLEGEAHKLTEAGDGLAALKGRLLQNIPIPGLEIRDGNILLNGIAFEHVNDAERYRIAIEVARLKAGELGLIVLDRAEIFDSASWESFRQAALASGLQIVAARVSDGPLEVQSAERSGIVLDEGASELITGVF